ncbi:helix-turn-helix transcriptional regulator [Streptomyces sp. DSM 41014]|uniref:Helix-turn-helix transcriptional regulator n=1 Tax=Streptomyces hintoniae TaxID=3075521 RepID=A0ABU2UV17_9ACTN|nr:helix-turn-helix transcriptional regulator [Streptomyces sp. DSM 41014]MDT0476890.1 helix-turn-helix transcriptional regulator [Streptomyces sp. DSM 41014]
MGDDRRQQFGQYLAGLRRATGKSQRQLAAVLCSLSGTQSVTRTEVSRWERGGRIPDVWLPYLAAALATPETQLRQAVAYARGDSLAQLPGPTATLAHLLPPGDPLEPLRARTGQRVGADAVTGLAGRVHALRLADDVLSGGDLIAPAFRELTKAITLYRGASYSSDTGRGLLVQIGELAQITGWVASDAGRVDDAERAYRLGISAAKQAGDGPLVAHLAGSLAYQWSNTGRERDGVDLATAALAEAGVDAPGQTRALFHDRVAWAHTRLGRPHAQQAIRALGEAHDALDDGADDEAPLWAYWVSREELEVMDARVFTELHRPLRAVPLLTDVLTRYDATRARELALYRSWLAVALADANEPEQAAAEALRVVELSRELSSTRTAARVRAVLERLTEYDDVPEVRDVLAGHGHLLLV